MSSIDEWTTPRVGWAYVSRQAMTIHITSFECLSELILKKAIVGHLELLELESVTRQKSSAIWILVEWLIQVTNGFLVELGFLKGAASIVKKDKLLQA